MWLVTFPLAWWSLGRLVAQAVDKKQPYRKGSFWLEFIFYRLVIFAPYGVLLFGDLPIGPTIMSLIWGWVILALILSFLRVLGSKLITRLLWWVYGWFYDGLTSFYPYKKLLNQVIRRLDVDGGHILDLGAGTGNLSRLVLSESQNVEVVAVDSSATMVHKAKRKLANKRAEVVKSDLLDYLIDQPASSFDRVAMVNVLYAFPEREELWENLIRVIKPNGRVVITNSDRGGSGPLIKEHLNNDSFWKLLDLRLVVVGIIDYFISQLEKSQVFDFADFAILKKEIEIAGGKPSEASRVYGGANLLFSISKK